MDSINARPSGFWKGLLWAIAATTFLFGAINAALGYIGSAITVASLNDPHNSPARLFLLRLFSLSPLYFVGGFVLVLLALVILAAMESRTKRTKEPRQHEMRPTSDADVRAALEASQQSLKEMQVKNRDLTERVQKLALAKADSDMLRRLVPLIRSYRTTVELAGRISLFIDAMEKVEPSGDLDKDLRRVQAATEANTAKFNAELRYALIRLTTDLKSQYGLVHASLTDAQIVRDIVGHRSAEEFHHGLEELSVELQKMLADAASQLNI